MRLGTSLLLALLALATVTLWRASQRETAAERDQPPEGQFVNVNGQQVHYLMRGTGPDQVLVHGASGSAKDFDFGLIDALARKYRVIAVDRPGFGYSAPLANGDASLEAQVVLLRAAVEKIGVNSPILVGQSYGGSVALRWALDAPPPALVLISAPSMPWPGPLDWWYRLNETAFARAILTPIASAWLPRSYVEATIKGIFAPDPVPRGYLDVFATPLTTRRSSLSVNLAQVNALKDQLAAMQPLYGGLTIPVELVHGDADTVVPLPIHSEPLSHLLPDAVLTVIPKAGHMPHHSHASEILAAIDRAALRAGLR